MKEKRHEMLHGMRSVPLIERDSSVDSSVREEVMEALVSVGVKKRGDEPYGESLANVAVQDSRRIQREEGDSICV